MTVIPAHPGWYVVAIHGDAQSTEENVIREPILAWLITHDEQRPDALRPLPITLTGVAADYDCIQTPDGKYDVPDGGLQPTLADAQSMYLAMRAGR
jgi:hypothetical protein